MALSFSAEARKQIDALLPRYPTTQAACLPLLHLAQREFGDLRDDVCELVAGTLGLPLAHVFGVVTFYTMFHREPVGDHVLMVCTNVSCMLRGSDQVMGAIEKKLGIGPGQTTVDRRFTLVEEECLAACGHAPMMVVGDRYFMRLDPARVEAALDELAATPGTH